MSFGGLSSNYQQAIFSAVVDVAAASITTTPGTPFMVSFNPVVWILFQNNTNESVDVLLSNGTKILHVAASQNLIIDFKANRVVFPPSNLILQATSTAPTTGSFSISSVCIGV